MEKLYTKKYLPKKIPAFTLVEIITVLTIAAMIIIATINVYGRVKATADSINAHLDKNTLPKEILQRIAEDLDRLAAPGFDTTVTIRNKIDNTYNVSQLVIENKYYDTQDKPQTFQKVTWQAEYDPFSDSIILYRAHSGLQLEDPVIDADKSILDSQAYYQDRGIDLFVPLASGITFFKIEVLENDKLLPAWSKTELPKAVFVTISFAPFVQDIDGSFYIPEEEKISRTIAVDRTRKIPYKFLSKEFDLEEELEQDQEDPNSLTSSDIQPEPTDETER